MMVMSDPFDDTHLATIITGVIACISDTKERTLGARVTEEVNVHAETVGVIYLFESMRVVEGLGGGELFRGFRSGVRVKGIMIMIMIMIMIVIVIVMVMVATAATGAAGGTGGAGRTGGTVGTGVGHDLI